MRVGYLTDKGNRRLKNEDSVMVVLQKRFFMLSDGVGGNKAGEIASRTALDALEDYILKNEIPEEQGKDKMFLYFEDAVNFVNEVVCRLSEGVPEYDGMATTLVFAYIGKDALYISNIGDSRVYLIHGDEIYQITEDHTYVNDLIKMGVITQEEAINHNKKNVITRAIGEDAYSGPDCFSVNYEKGDKILMCTDGLYTELGNEDLLREMLNADDMKTCARTLVDKAKLHGGNDNISVICIDKMEESDEQ